MNVPAGAPPATLRFSALLALAWPIVLARATQAVIGFTDALMVAPLGENALAAASTGGINVFAIIILPMGTVFIVQSFAAQLTGRGDRLAARRYAWYGLGIAGGAMLVALAALPLLPRVLGLFSYAPEVRVLMTEYLQLRLLSVGAIVGTEALGAWFGGLGNTRLQMISGVVAMVLNVALNWVLIYGHLGAPALGVRGTALASAIASWCGFTVLALCFWRGWGGAGRALGKLGLRWRELARVLRFGLPTGVNWFLEFGAFAVFLNVAMAHFGTVPLAAINVTMSINQVSFMPAFGMASAGAILVGQAVGRDARDEVPGIVKKALQLALVWMSAVGLLYFTIPDVLVGWFAPETEHGEELLRAGATMLAIASAWQLFDAVAMVLSEALRAAGDTAWTLYARIALAWLVFLPGVLLAIFVFGGGVVAAMVCLVLWIALLAVAIAWRFRSGAWRRIQLVEEAPPVD